MMAMAWLSRWRWWWFRRQVMPRRYYGSTGTIHPNGWVDVETLGNRVVAVWFRCQPLPFKSREVDGVRASEMFRMYREHPVSEIVGMDVRDNDC